MVVGNPTGDSHSVAGMRFRLKDVSGTSSARVLVDYHGSVPDLFKPTRMSCSAAGSRTASSSPTTLARDECPSKYAPANSKKT